MGVPFNLAGIAKTKPPTAPTEKDAHSPLLASLLSHVGAKDLAHVGAATLAHALGGGFAPTAGDNYASDQNAGPLAEPPYVPWAAPFSPPSGAAPNIFATPRDPSLAPSASTGAAAQVAQSPYSMEEIQGHLTNAATHEQSANELAVPVRRSGMRPGNAALMAVLAGLAQKFSGKFSNAGANIVRSAEESTAARHGEEFANSMNQVVAQQREFMARANAEREQAAMKTRFNEQLRVSNDKALERQGRLDLVDRRGVVDLAKARLTHDSRVDVALLNAMRTAGPGARSGLLFRTGKFDPNNEDDRALGMALDALQPFEIKALEEGKLTAARATTEDATRGGKVSNLEASTALKDAQAARLAEVTKHWGQDLQNKWARWRDLTSIGRQNAATSGRNAATHERNADTRMMELESELTAIDAKSMLEGMELMVKPAIEAVKGLSYALGDPKLKDDQLATIRSEIEKYQTNIKEIAGEQAQLMSLPKRVAAREIRNPKIREVYLRAKKALAEKRKPELVRALFAAETKRIIGRQLDYDLMDEGLQAISP